jgi:Flp pilus assembly protein TadG
MTRHNPPRCRNNSRGQSLVETALMLPLLIMIVLNVVNLGYFFLVIINLTGAARSSTLYSIEGSYTPYASQEPSSGGSTPTTTQATVAYTVYKDLTGALSNPTSATVQVCSQMNVNSGTGSGVNGSGANQLANCVTCTSSGCGAVGTGSPAPSADPEAPSFVANQVDITYQFHTLFTGRIFNIPLQAFSGICSSSGSCIFTRRARMRSMGP